MAHATAQGGGGYRSEKTNKLAPGNCGGATIYVLQCDCILLNGKGPESKDSLRTIRMKTLNSTKIFRTKREKKYTKKTALRVLHNNTHSFALCCGSASVRFLIGNVVECASELHSYIARGIVDECWMYMCVVFTLHCTMYTTLTLARVGSESVTNHCKIAKTARAIRLLFFTFAG